MNFYIMVSSAVELCKPESCFLSESPPDSSETTLVSSEVPLAVRILVPRDLEAEGPFDPATVYVDPSSWPLPAATMLVSLRSVHTLQAAYRTLLDKVGDLEETLCKCR